MKTVSIISHKGGAGKTSSAVMLAEDLARRGHRVVLIDADRQRAAGFLLGIRQPNGMVQQTEDPKLRYFCSARIPLKDLPAKAEELSSLFDVAVIDTPSLDDPLAKVWLKLTEAALMVLPVEPVSVKTLGSAEMLLEGVRKLNPRIQLLGVLPTLFDESDPSQRTLMLELISRRGEGLLSPPIPLDPGLAHRAEEKDERRTEARDATRQAYAATGAFLVSALGLGGSTAPFSGAVGLGLTGVTSASHAAPAAPARTGSSPAVPARDAAPAAPATAAPVRAGRPPAFRWALAALVALLLLALGAFGTRVVRDRARGPQAALLVPASSVDRSTAVSR